MAAKGAGAVESEILRGMKAIVDFSGLSEATIIKFCSEFDDFPVKKNGTYISHRVQLNEWVRDYVAGRK